MHVAMVVDDNAHILELVARALETEGFKVFRARDGNEAKQLLEPRVFDLLVTDIMMPGSTGLDLVAYLKEQKAPTRIIVLSGVTAETALTDQEMCEKLGVDAYLSKPCRVETIMRAVRTVMRNPPDARQSRAALT